MWQEQETEMEEEEDKGKEEGIPTPPVGHMVDEEQANVNRHNPRERHIDRPDPGAAAILSREADLDG